MTCSSHKENTMNMGRKEIGIISRGNKVCQERTNSLRLLVTSATLVVTGALLLVTRFAIRINLK